MGLVVLAFLVSLMLPSVPDKGLPSREVQKLSNMRQLYTATFTMAMDGQTNRALVAWPGDRDGTFSSWATNMVSQDYVRLNDFCKLLSADGKRVTPADWPFANTNAILAYNVRGDSPDTTVLFTSANFTNTPTGGVGEKATWRTGKVYFVVFRKGGDGTIYSSKQIGDSNAIGSFVPLCK